MKSAFIMLTTRRDAIGDDDPRQVRMPDGTWIVWDENFDSLDGVDAGFETFDEAAVFAYAQSLVRGAKVEFGNGPDHMLTRSKYRQWLLVNRLAA